MLWARANHGRTNPTLAVRRTKRRVSPRLRAWELAHSAVAARSLSMALASSLPMRARHAATPGGTPVQWRGSGTRSLSE